MVTRVVLLVLIQGVGPARWYIAASLFVLAGHVSRDPTDWRLRNLESLVILSSKEAGDLIFTTTSKRDVIQTDSP